MIVDFFSLCTLSLSVCTVALTLIDFKLKFAPVVLTPERPDHRVTLPCLPFPLASRRTHIFLSCGSFLKIPVASSTANSLLFRRLGCTMQRWSDNHAGVPPPPSRPPSTHSGVKTHSSAVYCGMWSGILVSFWLEQSTVVPSQRHFSGQAKSAKQSPPSLLR